MNEALQVLLASATVWRARGRSPGAGRRALPTGWPALDEALPDGGWPLGALVEVLLPEHGVGELQLLLPALRTAARGGWFAFVAPPHAPYAPALAQAGIDPERVLRVDVPATADRLWAVEQALRSRACDAVLAWLDAVDGRWLRRLCLAAEGGPTLAIAFRPLRRAREASPASLRLALEPDGATLNVRIVKGRGGPRLVRNAFAGGVDAET